MMKSPRRSLQVLAFVFSVVGCLEEVVPVEAMASRTSCSSVYYTCMDNASQLDAFWKRSAAGWNCYVDLAACVRELFV